MALGASIDDMIHIGYPKNIWLTRLVANEKPRKLFLDKIKTKPEKYQII